MRIICLLEVDMEGITWHFACSWKVVIVIVYLFRLLSDIIVKFVPRFFYYCVLSGVVAALLLDVK